MRTTFILKSCHIILSRKLAKTPTSTRILCTRPPQMWYERPGKMWPRKLPKMKFMLMQLKSSLPLMPLKRKLLSRPQITRREERQQSSHPEQRVSISNKHGSNHRRLTCLQTQAALLKTILRPSLVWETTQWVLTTFTKTLNWHPQDNKFSGSLAKQTKYAPLLFTANK